MILVGLLPLESECIEIYEGDFLDKEIEFLINRLSEAIEVNDKETISKINEEVDNILLKLLPYDDKQTFLSQKLY